MEHSRLTSLSLIEGLRTQNDTYWQRLNTLYGPIVEYWIEQSDIPTRSVADIKQEVFLAVARNIETYRHSQDSSGSLRRWIWGIARNKIVDYRRKEEKQAIARGGTNALGQLKALPDDPFEESDSTTSIRIRRELVTRALQILKSDFEEKTWMAFWKATVEEQPSADIAEELGMSKQAIRQAKYRVLQRLREELGEEFPHGNDQG